MASDEAFKEGASAGEMVTWNIGVCSVVGLLEKNIMKKRQFTCVCVRGWSWRGQDVCTEMSSRAQTLSTWQKYNRTRTLAFIEQLPF